MSAYGNQWGMGYQDFLEEEEFGVSFGQAPDPGSIVNAFSQSAMVIGQLIDLGFKAEYHPRRRMKLAADMIPRYMKGIKGMESAKAQAWKKHRAWKKKWKGRSCRKFKRGPLKGKKKDPIACSVARRKTNEYKKLAGKIENSRKLLMPWLLPPFAVPIPDDLIDNSLNMEIYADMLGKANKRLLGRGPGGRSPFKIDGGNIKTTRSILRALFIESLIFSLLPEAAVMNDPELRAARDTATATVMTAMNERQGLNRIFGRDPSQRKWKKGDPLSVMTDYATKDRTIPKNIRNDLLRKFIEWHGLGMVFDNMPLPPWIFGFPADGSGDPTPLPTLGAYLAINQALGQGRINEAVIKRMKGEKA